MKKTVLCLFLALALSIGCFTCCVGDSGEDSADISKEESKENSVASDSSVENSSAEDSSNKDSSEESSYVPKNPNDPIMEIPENLYYTPIDDFFNDSVFIGYSIIMHFGRYVGNWRDTVESRLMGTAQFRAGVGMSFRANETQDPSWPDTPLPKHEGVAYKFEDLPAAMGVKTLVIGLMPYSDMKTGTPDTCALEGAKYAMRGLSIIKQKNPNLHIIVLSGTYNTGRGEEIDLNRVYNENIRTYNNYVLEYCNKIGVDFIDVSTPMTNGKGYFVREWASDRSYHIKQDPYKIWIQVLREYAEKKQAGTWKNYDVMPELGIR